MEEVRFTWNMSTESNREIANHGEIKNCYPKYVVTLDELATDNANEIIIVHLADFSLNKEKQIKATQASHSHVC